MARQSPCTRRPCQSFSWRRQSASCHRRRRWTRRCWRGCRAARRPTPWARLPSRGRRPRNHLNLIWTMQQRLPYLQALHYNQYNQSNMRDSWRRYCSEFPLLCPTHFDRQTWQVQILDQNWSYIVEQLHHECRSRADPREWYQNCWLESSMPKHLKSILWK